MAEIKQYQIIKVKNLNFKDLGFLEFDFFIYYLRWN